SAAAALLDASAPGLSPELRGRVLEEASGNPLALTELPHAVSNDLALSPAAPLPLTERLEQAFAVRTSELPAATRPLLLVAALDDGGGLREALGAASLLEGRTATAAGLSGARAPAARRAG